MQVSWFSNFVTAVIPLDFTLAFCGPNYLVSSFAFQKGFFPVSFHFDNATMSFFPGFLNAIPNLLVRLRTSYIPSYLRFQLASNIT
jgi:hypothetical protein